MRADAAASSSSSSEQGVELGAASSTQLQLPPLAAGAAPERRPSNSSSASTPRASSVRRMSKAVVGAPRALAKGVFNTVSEALDEVIAVVDGEDRPVKLTPRQREKLNAQAQKQKEELFQQVCFSCSRVLLRPIRRSCPFVRAEQRFILPLIRARRCGACAGAGDHVGAWGGHAAQRDAAPRGVSVPPAGASSARVHGAESMWGEGADAASH